MNPDEVTSSFSKCIITVNEKVCSVLGKYSFNTVASTRVDELLVCCKNNEKVIKHQL